MKFSSLLLILVSTATASAHSLRLELRADSDSASSIASPSAPSNNVFTIQTGRISLLGQLNDQLSYKFRMRFNNESTTTGPDSLASKVDVAHIVHRMGDIALTAGKLDSDFGGYETIASSPDVYFKSEASQAITGTYKRGGTSFFFPAKYNSGVRVGWVTTANELSVLALNNPEAEVQAAPQEQSRLMSGVVYKGRWMDGRLEPIVSYHQVSGSLESGAPDSRATYATMAARWTQDNWYTQLDAVGLTSGERDIGGIPHRLTVRSLIGEGGWTEGPWTQKVKVEVSNVTLSPKTGSEVHEKWNGFGFIGEYSPFGDKNFRYHGALTQRTGKTDGLNETKEMHLVLGFYLQADLLKN